MLIKGLNFKFWTILGGQVVVFFHKDHSTPPRTLTSQTPTAWNSLWGSQQLELEGEMKLWRELRGFNRGGLREIPYAVLGE